ncbi:MAG: helix-turn-helix domain-containing protein [Pyrinomonadaceae bacterium]
MQPIFLKVAPAANESFDIRHEVARHFLNPWHFHPEYELNLVLKSTGVRFVGDSIERFTAGDLVLIGPNLPHYWRNDPHYNQRQSPANAESIVLRFSESCLGEGFFSRPEMQAIRNLLHRANRGIKINIAEPCEAITRMTKIIRLHGLSRVIEFLTLLDELSAVTDYQLLASLGFSPTLDPAESERINKVYAYLMDHFTCPINLDEVAAIANMNPAAFCRYFRQRTGKTLVSVINEIRVGYARKLLTEDNLNITEICYACGFQNISNFNRHFKRIVNLTPTQYRHHFL